MHLLLITHYFPPESNAPANRGYEHARAWIAQGHRVTVVTAAPSHPMGAVYPGYANRFASEMIDGIAVIRLPTVIAANRGIVARSIAFLSLFAAVLWYRSRLPRADAVVSTSPQFFSGMAGWLLRRKGTPWVLEIRDLWPESIVAVGAMRRNLPIRALEAIERAAYRRADLVVVTTEAHRRHVDARAPHTPTVVIPNGVTPGLLVAPAAAGKAFRAQHGLAGKFVITYLGTHGMAHGLDTVIDAAMALRGRDDVHFLLVGDGAERARLAARAAGLDLPNLTMLAQQRRDAVPAIWAASDAALVLLRRSETFTGVLPSKLVEAMALGKPVILGVEGEARELLERAGAGRAIPPEDPMALAETAVALAEDRAGARGLGESGARYAAAELDRSRLAKAMAAAIAGLAA